MKTNRFSRRTFLQHSLALTVGAPLAHRLVPRALWAADVPGSAGMAVSGARRSAAKVAIVSCRSYGPEVRAALEKSFDLLGGIGSLVRNKTVAVKLNLTGTTFAPFLGLPVGETYMTHYATVAALAASLFAAGAKRVRFVESTASTKPGWPRQSQKEGGTFGLWTPWARSSSRTPGTLGLERNTRSSGFQGAATCFPVSK